MVRLAGMALVWPEGVGMDRLLFGVAVPVQRRGPAEVVLNFVRMCFVIFSINRLVEQVLLL